MDNALREKILFLVKPLYQDLDGVSRMTDTERVAEIARRLYEAPDDVSRRHFDLLLLFHGLGRWLEKVGNISRTALAVREVSEEELQRVAMSVRRLESPVSDAERAVYAARLIDRAGLRGLAERFAQARREGLTIIDITREDDVVIPEWLPDNAARWIQQRRDARVEFQKKLEAELNLEDLSVNR